MPSLSSLIPEHLETDFIAAKRVASAVRKQSDTVRAEIIPDLIERRVSAHDAYWTLHRAECGKNVEVSTAWPIRMGDEKLHTTGRAISPGKRRERELFLPHAWHVRRNDLPELEKSSFDAIDTISTIRTVGEADFLRKLTAIHVILILAHFPDDISGRTTEDFLVYLAQQNGIPFSISRNGYRGGGLMLDSIKRGDKYYEYRNNVFLTCAEQRKLYQQIVHKVDCESDLFGVGKYTTAEMDGKIIGPTGKVLWVGPLMGSIQREIKSPKEKNWFRNKVIAKISDIAMALPKVVRDTHTMSPDADYWCDAYGKLYLYNKFEHANLTYRAYPPDIGNRMDEIMAFQALGDHIAIEYGKDSKLCSSWYMQLEESVASLQMSGWN